MKRNVISKIATAVVIPLLMLAGNVFSQTDASKTVSTKVVTQKVQSVKEMSVITPPQTPSVRSAKVQAKAPLIETNSMNGGMFPMDQNSQTPTTQNYTVVDLGTLGGDTSQAYGINNRGQIVGMAVNSNGQTRAFFYSNSPAQDLGTLGGGNSMARSINDGDEVVGNSYIVGDNDYHAFLYSNGVMHDLGTLSGHFSSYAYGVNKSSQIVGWSYGNSGYPRAFLYSNGSMQDLGTLGGQASFARGINRSGQVVGFADTIFTTHAFLYSGGVMSDLGTFYPYSHVSIAYGINDNSQIVGESTTDSNDTIYHAFLYSNGLMQDIGTLGGNNSVAYGLNNSGQVVGQAYTESNVGHAFLYSNSSMQDLNNLIEPTSGWTLIQANAINDAGQIVGQGINSNGQTHAFLLNPNSLTTIQIGKSHPQYGDGITQQLGKDSLIVITHGWIPLDHDPIMDTAWVDSMSNSIVQYLAAHNMSNWQVVGHKWIDGAHVQYPDATPGNQSALGNAKMDGLNLGNSIVSTGGWAHVHLIGHSAGAEVVQACSEVIKPGLPACTIHCTFLDPFTGLLFENSSAYGDKATWSDDYFTRDQETGGNAWPVTQGAMNHAYAVDVTYLDSHKNLLGVYASGPINEPCPKTETTHGWPIDFYMNTISGNLSGVYDSQDYGNFGFPLSEEVMGSSWSSLPTTYHLGNNPPQTLGIPDPDCIELFQSNTGTVPTDPRDFANPYQSASQIEEGLIQNNGTDLDMTADGPAWIATFINVTNPMNYVVFDAQFTNEPAGAGQFSVYWDTNAIGFLDESLVGTNLQHCVFSFPAAASNSVHMLGLRIDAPTNGASSSISITNVIMGYVGVSQSFTLSPTTNMFNRLPVFQLTGQSGFNYRVQATTNLLSPWTDIAILVNSNGVVPFIDPDSTNYSQRFYRVVAPY